jgi:hypothetical protein
MSSQWTQGNKTLRLLKKKIHHQQTSAHELVKNFKENGTRSSLSLLKEMTELHTKGSY